MNMLRTKLCALAAVATSLVAATAAHADVVVDITQGGSNVLLTSSGTFDLSTATLVTTVPSFQQALDPLHAFIVFGTQGPLSVYSLTGPSSIGTGAGVNVTNDLGTAVGVDGFDGIFGISSSYVSNSSFSGSGSINNATLASLGLTTGTYTYLVGQNVVTVNVGVPEPATWAMMLLGFAGIGFAVRRERRVEATV